MQATDRVPVSGRPRWPAAMACLILLLGVLQAGPLPGFVAPDGGPPVLSAAAPHAAVALDVTAPFVRAATKLPDSQPAPPAGLPVPRDIAVSRTSDRASPACPAGSPWAGRFLSPRLSTGPPACSA